MAQNAILYSEKAEATKSVTLHLLETGDDLYLGSVASRAYFWAYQGVLAFLVARYPAREKEYEKHDPAAKKGWTHKAVKNWVEKNCRSIFADFQTLQEQRTNADYKVFKPDRARIKELVETVPEILDTLATTPQNS